MNDTTYSSRHGVLANVMYKTKMTAYYYKSGLSGKLKANRAGRKRRSGRGSSEQAFDDPDTERCSLRATCSLDGLRETTEESLGGSLFSEKCARRMAGETKWCGVTWPRRGRSSEDELCMAERVSSVESGLRIESSLFKPGMSRRARIGDVSRVSEPRLW